MITMDDVQKLALIYTRVSSERQVDGYSLDSQEDLCRNKLEQLGFIPVKTYREEGVSAKTNNRPQLQEMLAYAMDKKNGISAIIAYSLSRFNRNTEDYLTIRRLLSAKGVQLLSVTDTTGDSPADKFIETILASHAEMENGVKSVNVTNSLRRRFNEGHITAKPPLGYLMEKVNNRSVAVKDPAYFELIQKMWHRIRDQKLSVGQVARETSKILGRRVLSQTISRMFSNKFYMGTLISAKYGEAKGLHEPMIDEETYWAVRSIIEGKKPNQKLKRIRQRDDFPLRGILYCPHCSHKLSSAWSTGKRQKFAYYICSTRGKHAATSYSRDKIMEKFDTLLDSITFKESQLQWISEMVKETYHSKYDLIIQSEREIEKEIANLNEVKKTLSYKHLKGLYTDAEFQTMKDDIELEKVVKQGVLSEKKLERIDIDTILEFIVYYLGNTKRAWYDATLEGKYALGCSMFPNGLVFENGEFRTPQLGYSYALTTLVLQGGSTLGDPNVRYFEHLVQEYLTLYQTTRPYVTL